MSFVNSSFANESGPPFQVDYRLHQWLIRVNSQHQLEIQIADEVEQHSYPSQQSLIPEGSRALTIIVDNGFIVEKIYITPAGKKISVKYS